MCMYLHFLENKKKKKGAGRSRALWCAQRGRRTGPAIHFCSCTRNGYGGGHNGGRGGRGERGVRGKVEEAPLLLKIIIIIRIIKVLIK